MRPVRAARPRRAVIAVLVTITSPAWAARQDGPAGTVATLAENFTGGTLAPIWATHYPTTETFGQSAWLPDEVEMRPSGGLRLRADRRPFGGKSFASGVITSFGGFSQTYGYFEMRARMPGGDGIWPAFWLLPIDQSWPPEIDIVEWLGRDPATVHTTLHYPIAGSSRGGQEGGGCTVRNLTGAWHRYGLAWRPGSLVWSVDGNTCYSVTGANVPDKPMYLLADIAVGASDSWDGAPDSSTAFPANFDIAYIHAFQYRDLPPETPRPLAFRSTSVSDAAIRPGQSIAISTAVAVGDAAVANVAVTGTVFGSASLRNNGNTSYATLGNLAARTRAAVKLTYQRPAAAPDGLYDVAINLSGGNGGINEWEWIAAQFYVGPPPPLPTDSAPFPAP